MAAAVLSSGAPADVGMAPERVRRAAALFRSWAENADVRTIAALAARRGRVVLHEAFGPLTGEAGSSPAGRDALFPVFSLTKLFTATAAMILVEEGRLGLHVPISWYLPAFTGEGKEGVTLFHLLTHTAGIRDEDAGKLVEEQGAGSSAASRRARQLAATCATPLFCKPGSAMIYSSRGYDLVGELVEKTSGMLLGDFLHERIFAPLGMQDTSLTLPPAKDARAVRRTEGSDWSFVNSQEFRTTPHAAGSAWSTAADLGVFGQLFLNRGTYGGARILGPATVGAMMANQIPGVSSEFFGEVFPEASWGLGWSVVGRKRSTSFEQDLLSPQAVCHGGAVGLGLWVDPAYEIVAVYLIVSTERVQGQRMGWCPDVFINVVMAGIVE